MLPRIDRDKCTGCGECREVCPPLALCLVHEKAELEAEYCEECGFCAARCPAQAITIPFPTSADLGAKW